MEIALLIAGIWVLVLIVRRALSAGQSGQSTPPPSYARSAAPKSPDVYRPRSRASGGPKIVFETPEVTEGPVPSGEALAGLHDAFTGAPLDARLGLHQCTNCRVYYHAESVSVLREENASRCVACGNGSIVALTATQTKTSRGRDYNPDVITLSNFRGHFDRVVTFEGRVHAVKVSKRGKDYAVMFENASWTKGLKLVFFRGAVRNVGGPAFIQGLESRTVRVRGLLIDHNRFGPEIVISERGMILQVAP